MSDAICYRDAYVRSVLTRVVETDGAAVLTDATPFYPGGGGQPADSGWLRVDEDRAWRVSAARKQGSEIWHELEDADEPPAVGSAVSAELDWDRRHALMRTHSDRKSVV